MIASRQIFLSQGDGWTPEPNSSIFISTDAYIDLGVVPTTDIFFQFKGAIYSGLTGCIYQSSIRFHWGGHNRTIQWPWTPYLFTDSSFYPDNDGQWSIDALGGTINYYGQEYVITNFPSFTSNVTIAIGARHFDNTYDNLGEALVRRITYGTGGVILNDFYLRVMDGVAGLYDIIGGRFYTNIGSGGTITYQTN